MNYFDTFRDFLNSLQISSNIEPLEYELTYVNHIPLDDNISDLSEIGELFPDFYWRHETHPPQDISWRTIVSLPEQRGRLLLSLRNKQRKPDDQSILVLKLSAKGMHEDPDLLTSMHEWFDISHDTVVELFTKVTSQKVQTEQWGKDSDG